MIPMWMLDVAVVCAGVFLVSTLVLAYLYAVRRKQGMRMSVRVKSLTRHIEERTFDLERIKIDTENKRAELKALFELEQRGNELRKETQEAQSKLTEIQSALAHNTMRRDKLLEEIEQARNDLAVYKPALELISLGFFEEPEYLFETSDRFKEEIRENRAKQKRLVSLGVTIELPDSIAIIDDDKLAQKVLKNQARLMLAAFNMECDKLMGMVKPSNFANVLERIEKAATNIEKTSISLGCGFSQEYVQTKMLECELVYQHALKLQREKEEQERIRDQMREERQAIRDFERAVAKAQKEEALYEDALEMARTELEVATEAERDKLQERVLFLEKKLEEAIDREQRAKSMAEQTRRGYVYVISNVGAFGENVYKIGLTRRLEPMDRVKELGDASVPFSFDVHALVFSEDAPALEAQLHQAFAHQRVNVVNFRKEFFRVPIEDIREKMLELAGDEAEFSTKAPAEEYRESRKLWESDAL